MFLDPRHRRALVRIEAALTRSDPGLAGQFQRFNDWVAYQKRAGRRGLARTVIVVILMTAIAALLIAGAMTESGGLGGNRGPGLTAAQFLDGKELAARVARPPALCLTGPGVTRH